MKYEKKFRPQEQQELSQTHGELQANQTIREFATPEEVLRFDAKQTLVPDGIAQRLSRSLQREAPRPWWKKIFE